MRVSLSLILASLLATASGAAFGAPLNGTEITVNPLPATGDSKLLLYPGGQYERVVQPLRQPGQTAADSGLIHLHMPAEHSAVASRPAVSRRAPRAAAAPRPEAAPRAAAVAPRRAEATPRTAAVAPRTPTPAPARKVAEAPPAKAPPAGGNGYNPSYGGFGAPQASAGGMVLAMPGAAGATAPAAPSKQLAKIAPPPPSAIAPPAQPGLTKHSVILFAAGAPDPAQSALGSIKLMAGDLNGYLTAPSSRIQLLAYGGDKGDKGSDARRLSLKRALAIRQVLIDDGVPSERIDVRAMGGADDGGPADRVDVFIKT